MSVLAGKRILLVEDEPIVAMMAADIIEELGATVVGPAMTLAAALSLSQTAEIDAAVLDINLNGLRSDPAAEALARRRIPFVFATGYGAPGAGAASGAPVLDKPYTEQALKLAQTGLFSQAR